MAAPNKKLFSVVEYFDGEDEDETSMEVIPTKWITNKSQTEAFYPPASEQTRVQRYAMSLQTPDETTWQRFRIICHHDYDTYFLAKRECNKAIQRGVKAGSASDLPKKRRGKKPSRYNDTSSEDDAPVVKSKAPPKSKYKKVKVLSISSDESDKEPDLQAKLRAILQKNSEDKKKPKAKSSTVTLKTKVKSPIKKAVTSQSMSSPLQSPPKASGTSVSSFSILKNSPLKSTMLAAQAHSSKEFGPDEIVPGSSGIDLAVQAHSSKEFGPDEIATGTDLDLEEEQNTSHVGLFTDSEGPAAQNFENLIKSTHSEKALNCVKELFSKLPNSRRSIPVMHSQPVSSDLQSVNLKLLISLMQDVSSKLDIVTMNQERLLQSHLPEEAVLVRPTNLPPLPLKTEDDFFKFEKFLREDLAFTRTCNYLLGKIMGKHDEAEATRHMLGNEVLLANKLQRVISWAGSHGTKIAFQNSLLQQVVFCALLKKFKKSDLTDATAAMKRWFETSSQRAIDDNVVTSPAAA